MTLIYARATYEVNCPRLEKLVDVFINCQDCKYCKYFYVDMAAVDCIYHPFVENSVK